MRCRAKLRAWEQSSPFLNSNSAATPSRQLPRPKDSMMTTSFWIWSSKSVISSTRKATSTPNWKICTSSTRTYFSSRNGWKSTYSFREISNKLITNRIFKRFRCYRTSWSASQLKSLTSYNESMGSGPNLKGCWDSGPGWESTCTSNSNWQRGARRARRRMTSSRIKTLSRGRLWRTRKPKFWRPCSILRSRSCGTTPWRWRSSGWTSKWPKRSTWSAAWPSKSASASSPTSSIRPIAETSWASNRSTRFYKTATLLLRTVSYNRCTPVQAFQLISIATQAPRKVYEAVIPCNTQASTTITSADSAAPTPAPLWNKRASEIRLSWSPKHAREAVSTSNPTAPSSQKTSSTRLATGNGPNSQKPWIRKRVRQRTRWTQTSWVQMKTRPASNSTSPPWKSDPPRFKSARSSTYPSASTPDPRVPGRRLRRNRPGSRSVWIRSNNRTWKCSIKSIQMTTRE